MQAQHPARRHTQGGVESRGDQMPQEKNIRKVNTSAGARGGDGEGRGTH